MTKISGKNDTGNNDIYKRVPKENKKHIEYFLNHFDIDNIYILYYDEYVTIFEADKKEVIKFVHDNEHRLEELEILNHLKSKKKYSNPYIEQFYPISCDGVIYLRFPVLLEFDFDNVYDIDVILDYISQLIVGLRSLHRNNVIHGDIKMDNIMLIKHISQDEQEKEEYRPILMDFGCSIIIDDEIRDDKYISAGNYVVHCEKFRAPECRNIDECDVDDDFDKLIRDCPYAFKKHVTIQSDVYALGSLFMSAFFDNRARLPEKFRSFFERMIDDNILTRLSSKDMAYEWEKVMNMEKNDDP